MNELKQTHQDFVDEFKTKLNARRDEFVALGIEWDDSDIGIPLYNILSYLREHPTDEVIRPFVESNQGHIGDIYWGSPFVKNLHPMTVTFSYRDKPISTRSFGPDVYADVYGTFWGMTKTMADQFLPSTNIITKYLEGDQEARTHLMAEFDFQRHRNWTIIWAKLDWTRLCFPRCYSAMLADGNFLSVEEVEERLREGDQ